MDAGVIAVGLGFIAGAYAMAQGGVISASADLEGKSTPWGAGVAGAGAFVIVVNVLLAIILPNLGGEGEMIPLEAWPLITGSLTMIGASFAAAICIMIGIKSGIDMITEKPELSIWSLLFIALGEGLAIYGLIITILIIGGG